jgi:translation elongation factor EF-Tu-like GTPase
MTVSRALLFATALASLVSLIGDGASAADRWKRRPGQPKGNEAVLRVNAPDGPMPPFVTEVENAKASGASRVVVRLQNTSRVNDPELIDLQKMEIDEILALKGFDDSHRRITECSGAC